MERHRFGNSDLTISAIGLGCYGMSGVYGPADDAESIATIRRARSEEQRLNSSHTVIYTLSLHDALPICNSDLTISAIGLGCYGMSGVYGPADDAESIATIRRA